MLSIYLFIYHLHMDICRILYDGIQSFKIDV